MIVLKVQHFKSFKKYLESFHSNSFTLFFCLFTHFLSFFLKLLSCVQLYVTASTIKSMEFSRPEYWSGQSSLLQGIIPTQVSKPGLLHCKQIRYQLRHKGSPRILEWQPIPSPGDLPNPGIKPGSSFTYLRVKDLNLLC